MIAHEVTAEKQAELVVNALLSREGLVEKLLDPRRDIDNECGYSKTIDINMYRVMYDREMGQRVVSIYPEETWAMEPRIFETKDPEKSETQFEKDWDQIGRTLGGGGHGKINDDQGHMLCHYMHRADELSGIGHYGILFLGLDDGKAFIEPVAGLDKVTGKQVDGPEHELLYIRALDESLVNVKSLETNKASPRFGQPTFYNVTFADSHTRESDSSVVQDNTLHTVHWTRVIHVADNRKNSEVFGVPRMRPVWNRLYDLRKVLGGSGEAYWKGGFPGIAIETQTGMEDAELDEEKTRKMMFDYMNGMQRYLALTGMTAKSMSPQIADPSMAFDVVIKSICVTLGVPYRVFMGTEEAKLAGKQDDDRWGRRLMRRQQRYVSPHIIRPTVDRLIDIRVLAAPSEKNGYTVEWPNMTEVSEMDKAQVSKAQTEAMASYVGSGVDTLVRPFDYLTMFMGIQENVADQILEATVDHINEANPEEDDVKVPGRNPKPSMEKEGEQLPPADGKVVGGVRIKTKPPGPAKAASPVKNTGGEYRPPFL